jgi:hypothetical protein
MHSIRCTPGLAVTFSGTACAGQPASRRGRRRRRGGGRGRAGRDSVNGDGGPEPAHAPRSPPRTRAPPRIRPPASQRRGRRGCEVQRRGPPPPSAHLRRRARAASQRGRLHGPSSLALESPVLVQHELPEEQPPRQTRTASAVACVSATYGTAPACRSSETASGWPMRDQAGGSGRAVYGECPRVSTRRRRQAPWEPVPPARRGAEAEARQAQPTMLRSSRNP